MCFVRIVFPDPMKLLKNTKSQVFRNHKSFGFPIGTSFQRRPAFTNDDKLLKYSIRMLDRLSLVYPLLRFPSLTTVNYTVAWRKEGGSLLHRMWNLVRCMTSYLNSSWCQIYLCVVKYVWSCMRQLPPDTTRPSAPGTWQISLDVFKHHSEPPRTFGYELLSEHVAM